LVHYFSGYLDFSHSFRQATVFITTIVAVFGGYHHLFTPVAQKTMKNSASG
jgi:hypothetical protein